MELVFYAMAGALWGCIIFLVWIDPWFERRERRRENDLSKKD